MKRLLTTTALLALYVLTSSAHLTATPTQPSAPTSELLLSTPSPVAAPANVQESFKPSFKAGGYIIGKYSYSDQEGTASNGGFDLRLFRLYGNGYVFPKVYYRFQLEINDAPGTDRGPRVLDAFVEWQPRREAQLKLGQFKRCFGFENPMSPLDIGFGNFSQATLKLQSINDRMGAHRSSGRDIGVQLQGDLFTNERGHSWLHYQVGLYNGQGINHKDINRHKDLIAGLWISPLPKLRIGAFGWNGRHTNEANRTQTVDFHRYSVGVKYEADWTVRGEYVHNVGTTLKGGSDRADGWYVAVGAPVPQVKGLKVYGKWDAYRDDARTWNSMRTDYCLAADYWLNKNFKLQLNLTHTYDRSLPAGADKHFNVIDAQVVARF